MKTKLGAVWDNQFFQHDTGPGHPERIERLRKIEQVLKEKGLWEKLSLHEGREATETELLRAHTKKHVTSVFDAFGKATYFDADTRACPESAEAALKAAGGSIDMAKKVFSGVYPKGFCFVRPPGHHAESNRVMGFCYLNNIAVAAHALFKENAKKILIVDWDVHHGNGTQEIFESDSRCLFFSIHEGANYPGTGREQEVGVGQAEGYTLNVPMRSGANDSDYFYVFQRLLRPVVQQFQPEIILLSAGYDAHTLDPLGGMNVTTEGFAALTKELVALSEEFCQGKLIAFLEGGYHLQGLADSVAATVSSFLQKGCLLEEVENPSPWLEQLVQSQQERLQQYWSFGEQ